MVSVCFGFIWERYLHKFSLGYCLFNLFKQYYNYDTSKYDVFKININIFKGMFLLMNLFKLFQRKSFQKISNLELQKEELKSGTH